MSAEGKVYYLALVRDASVEMAQKEQTRQLIIAVDHLDRPVIVLDPERHIVQCNRAFTEMFGYCISEASGMQPDTLLTFLNSLPITAFVYNSCYGKPPAIRTNFCC